MEAQDTCPLPEDPTLAATAVAMRDAGHWGEVVDRNWRIVYMTDELRASSGLGLELVPVPLGGHVFAREVLETRLGWGTGPIQLQAARDLLSAVGPWVLADIPGGRAALAEMVDSRLADIVNRLSPIGLPSTIAFPIGGISPAGGGPVPLRMLASRVYEADGRIAGTALILKPAVGMSVLATMAATGDVGHFQRMQQVAKATRRPAAVLFADLESSSPLARRLSTHAYFSLGRRLTRAADQCVIDSGGLVGRHVGDGVVAFFLAETAGSESAAARACIEAARDLRQAMTPVAQRSHLAPEDLVLRFGLHWGATLYVGLITTIGRTEITALGDEVNEGARIEACATGGLALASKALMERLEPDDAAALGLDPDRVTYIPLADLPMATEKARRDAPAIAVCEV
jgi:class 3 adenylate cyclase